MAIIDKIRVNGTDYSLGGGVSDYNEIDNKPKINNVELDGNKTTQDLHIMWTGTSAEYEEQKNDIPVGTIVNITDDYDEPTPSSSIDYSTEEQFTGKKWIDGKKIYQKSFIYEGQVTTSGITIGTVDNFYELTNVELVICNSSRAYWLTPTSSSRDNTMRAEVTTGGTVKILTDTPWSNPKVNLTIFYTKVGE